MSDFDLASLDDDFANATPPERKAFESIPEGNYTVRIYNLNLVKAKSSGDPMLSFELEILAGDFARKKLFRNMVINHNSLSYVKRDLAMIGWVGKLSEMENPERRRELIDVQLDVTVKNNGKDSQGRVNQNIYFNKKLTDLVPYPSKVTTDEPTPF